jgi:hypothetical protein
MNKAAQGAPLTLSIENMTVTFTSIDDMKFALDAKTQLPVWKYDELRALPVDALEKQAVDIRNVEGLLLHVLDASFTEPLSIDYQLREIDDRIFSEDHAWREFMEALNKEESKYSDYKRVALVKYLQYLASRQELIKRVYWSKYREIQGKPAAAEGPSSAVRETAIFDANELAGIFEHGGNQYQRLPRGEPRDVRLLPGQEIPMRLSVHPFKLVRADGAYLVDDKGKEYPLLPRRSTVGRSVDNDVALDSAFRAISRKHLILEFPSKEWVVITDRSSHGTFVPLRYLAEG